MDPQHISHLPGIKHREDLAKLINQRQYRIGIEVGVDRGGFSEALLTSSKLDVLYGVDIWGKYPERKTEAEQRLKPFGVRSKLIVGSSPSCANQFQDGYFDFIYIDADHRYRAVRADLPAFWAKLKPGGCMAGHDYVEAKLCGVIRAVDEFVGRNKLKLFTTMENGPALADRLVSWYFFKE
jgi:predicted O-methyltransferase YrrM